MGMRLIGPVYLIGGQDYNMAYLDWEANDSNTYLIDTGDPLVLVDCGCGDSMPLILENIRQMGFDAREITHVFITHAHMPHAGAAEGIRRNGVQIVASPPAAKVLRTGGPATVAYQYRRRFQTVDEVTEMADGEEIELGACRVRAVHLPGHSAGSTAFEVTHEARRLMFCGDAVRAPGMCQHRNRLGYDREAYVQSLLRLLEDPPDVLYPGHGTFCLSRTEHWIGQELSKLLATPQTHAQPKEQV